MSILYSPGGTFDLQKYMEFEHIETATRRERKIENLKVGGLILLGIGIALGIFLALISDHADGGNVAAVGVIPAMIGLAMFGGAWMMARGRRESPGTPAPRG